MAEYSLDYSKRKMAAVQAMAAEIEKIGKLKAEGGKALLAKHGYRGNQPKMALRGLRSFLTSEDSLFPDLLEKYESGELSPYKLAEGARQRTEKIGAQEVIVHSDTIHHANPLELGDAFDEMEPGELRDFLTEEFEVEGKAYGDSKINTRGQSYTTRGHLGQTTNPRGRYKATNEFSEPGLTEISAHPRGANDPLMKAPDVKPTTREEAKAFVKSKADIIKESQTLGAYADKDVRALVDQKMTERGIIQPGSTVYDPNLPDDTLQNVRKSLDNITDEVDIAKAFKTPKFKLINGVARFIPGVADNLALAGVVGVGVGGATLLGGGGVQAAGKNALTAAKDVATADIQDVKTSITTDRTNNLATTQKDLQGLAGLTGLASMIPGINLAGGVASATFSAASMFVGNRIQRDQTKENRQESLANPRAVNPDDEHVLTQTDKSFKSGRY